MNDIKDRKMKIVGLTNYLIDLHSAKKSIALIMIISSVAGIAERVLSGQMDSLALGAAMGLFFIFAPALLAGFFTSALTMVTRKTMTYRRSFYLAFFNSIILSVLYILGGMIGTGIYGVLDLLVYGYSLIFLMRLLVLSITYPYPLAGNVLLGSLQSVFGYLAILGAGILVPAVAISSMALLLKIIISLAIFLVGIWLFILLVNAPMKRNFGINTFTVANAFLENWFDQSNTIEDVLKSIGEKADILIGLIAFRAKKKMKSLFIIPYMHPGPFGEVGGGKMTKVFMERLDKQTRVFVPHGTATHDLNLTTTASLYKMANAIENNLDGIKYYNSGSVSVRAHKGKAKLIGQRFGNSLFMASTFSPNATEDIDFSIGLAAINELKQGYDNVIYADCHNCHKSGDHAIFSGDPVMFDLLDGVGLLDAKVRKQKSSGIRMGIAVDALEKYSYLDGVGPMGLRVSVIDVGGQKTAYVLFDSNNIVAGLREKIIAEIKKLKVNEVEVMTTDSHCVNSVRGVENPLGMKIRGDILVRAAVKTCKSALDNLEPVEVGATVIKVKGIDVFGPQRSIELVSTVNTMIAMMKIFSPLIFVSALMLSLLGVLSIGW